MYIDKKKAINGKNRISEKNLWGVAVIGGAGVCLAGMYIFRHKTKRWSFKAGFIVLVLLQCVFLVKWLV